MSKNDFISFDKLKEELLNNPKVKEHYDELEENFQVISDFISLRNKLNLTQRDLSEVTGIKQPSIARFETGQIKNISLSYLNKLIKPLGYKTKIVFEKE